MLERNLKRFSGEEFDLAVIGGGIYGAALAWEAASRGLSVALLEKDDFAGATSANSLKTIHGGFRYLQHADIGRLRASMRERKALMRIAPHLVHPLPVLVPTYGHGLKGREVVAAALVVNDLLGSDRNRRIDPQKRIPAGRSVSRRECLELLPGLEPGNLSGGAIFYDSQVYNSERLVIAFLQSAAEAGAVVANYSRVEGFLRSGDRIGGVRAVDAFSGDRFEVRARLTANTSGPWAGRILEMLNGRKTPPFRLAKAVNLVTRSLGKPYAVGLIGNSSYQDPGSLVKKKSSLLFIAPWRGYSIVGTTYRMHSESPDALSVTEPDVAGLLDAVNAAYPPAKLTRDDVLFVHSGLLPAESDRDPVRLTNHHEIIDHRRDGISGLISVVGVKYTTARWVAVETLNLLPKVRGISIPSSVSAEKPLYGGRIESFEAFLSAAIAKKPAGLNAEAVQSLVCNYGAAFPEVLRYHEASAVEKTLSPEQALLRAQILYGIRSEMALKLGDIVFRRTELGTAGHPGKDALRFSARVMGAELDWSDARIGREISQVEEKLRVNPC